MNIDISNIAPSEREVALQHPGTGDDLGMIWTLRSPHDPHVLDVQRKFQADRLKKRRADMSPDEFEALQIRTLVAHVYGWSFTDPNLTLDGEQPIFSQNLCQQVLRKHVWIREWLNIETGNAADFYRGSENG